MEDLELFADRRGVIRSAALPDARLRGALRSAARRGELVRLARGAYVRAETAGRLGRDALYRAVIHAAAVGRLPVDGLLCGPSALALWRLPALEAWPTTVHVVSLGSERGRHAGILVRHGSSRVDPGAVVDGLPVTSLARTVIDTAARGPLAAGLMAADAALRGITDCP